MGTHGGRREVPEEVGSCAGQLSIRHDFTALNSHG